MDLSDSTLVERACSGDRAAFEALVERYADRLHAVVRRLVTCDHEAQEVTQEAFLRAWRGLHGFNGEAQFFTWLYRIGINEANRRLKRNAPAANAQSLDGLVHEVSDNAPGPAAVAEQGDLRAALEAAVAALHPDYRTALVLRDIEGLSTVQTAEIMELSEAAVKSRVHRARLTVRAAVATYL
ncbi:MAG: sigma-70 family RNA polymerase sigma factor [Solirubrobacteraceae bacterium]|nr:sigma-70 family RNA polymerase sigma factor [Solirubrobacteraceae bacterium]